MYQNSYKSRAANKSSTVLYYIAVKVVLISSQQNRRSGSVYTFEQLIFEVYIIAWASPCWPGAFFLWKFMKEVLAESWGSFTCQQGERGQSVFTQTEEEPENAVTKLQGLLRYLWCQGCPRDTGMPAQWPWPSLPLKRGQFSESSQKGLGY